MKALRIRAFLSEIGRTAGCPACETPRPVKSHTRECKTYQDAWDESRRTASAEEAKLRIVGDPDTRPLDPSSTDPNPKRSKNNLFDRHTLPRQLSRPRTHAAVLGVVWWWCWFSFFILSLSDTAELTHTNLHSVLNPGAAWSHRAPYAVIGIGCAVTHSCFPLRCKETHSTLSPGWAGGRAGAECCGPRVYHNTP